MHKFSNNDFVILLLYIDDILIIGPNLSKIDNGKKELSKSFAIKDLGPGKLILRMKVIHDRKYKKLWLS